VLVCHVDISAFKEAVRVKNQNKELKKCMYINVGSTWNFVCPSPMQTK